MNELLFSFHIFLLIGAILSALRLGKSALIALLGLQCVIGNLFVTKQMICFGFHITCADVYTIGALFNLNLLQEYYGKQTAKKVIYTILFLLIFFMVMGQIHIKYLPSPFDTMQGVFEKLLTPTPRIMIVSCAVGIFCQRLDVLIYGRLKKNFPKWLLSFRFSLTSLLSQFIDTILFSFLALYGLVYSMTHIIIVSYLIKVCLIFCMAPFMIFSKRFIRDPIQI